VIGYIEGTILKKSEDGLLLLANQVGYEVLLPAIVMKSLDDTKTGETVALHIFHHQTERQPKPVLIGFNLEVEKEFFQYFISVEDIGPLKAVKAMSIPIQEIADAIESGDLRALTQLKGIGKRTAQKMIATLEGKLGKFGLMVAAKGTTETAIPEDFTNQVLNVMVNQLGHKASDAKQMIARALKHNSSITTPEELFEEVYRSEKS
jgi:Holliday junction DNA helicase RuvA